MRKTSGQLVRARHLFDDGFARPVSLDSAAAAAGLSKFHFVRVFRDAYGVTPHRYLVRRRLDEARRLLGESGDSVTDICFAVGFESLGSFCSVFRRETGVTPGAYRRGVRRLYQVLTPPAPLVVPACLLFMLGGPAAA